MWRGENPVEDFDRLVSLALWDLLDRQVDSVLTNMKDLRVSSARQLLALALQQREEIQIKVIRNPLILSSTTFPHPPE
jgi:hypothetical protein